MNSPTWDRIEGKWKQLKGDIRSRWGDLTDDEVEQAAGNREKFVGILQEKYGKSRQDVERELDEWAEQHKN